MKKTFQFIGLISLTCFSFFITEKTVSVVNNLDEIMIEIKENMNNYTTNPVDAIIQKDTIIPGINGRKVNTNKSYKLMKKNGYYNDKLYVYDYKKPNISLKDNIEKYIISGNPKKNMISLVFIINKNINIDKLLTILNNYNASSTFFVSESWFSNNNSLISQMILKNHNVGVLLDNTENSNYEWMDLVIKRINNQLNGFCLNKNKNKDILDMCVLKNNYTIIPKNISAMNPLLDIKKNLSSGDILTLEVNSKLLEQLSTIIIYIRSKGFTLNNLEENILE